MCEMTSFLQDHHCQLNPVLHRAPLKADRVGIRTRSLGAPRTSRMSTALSSVIFAIGIAGLFFLDREKEKRVSWSLWLPTVWLLLLFTVCIGMVAIDSDH